MQIITTYKRTFFAFAIALGIGSTLVAQGRGPSTSEERKKVIQLTTASEKDLMMGTSEADRFWFIKLVSDVPDITLEVGSVATWCSESMPEKQRPLALFQFMMSAVSFQIENPAKAKDVEAGDQAGLEGVLRAYENLIKKTPNARSSKMDEAIALREKGELAVLVKKLRAKK